MLYGVREICDVVFKAKTTMKVGDKTFFKGEPVIYFDSLTTSSLEGAVTTVYAQGGRGNARLVAWDGERTITLTMEDALISPAGFMILSGAGLIKEASETNKIFVHQTETTADVTKTTAEGETTVCVYVTNGPSQDSKAGTYVFDLSDDGQVDTEPYIPASISSTPEASGDYAGKYKITLKTTDDVNVFAAGQPVLVDYYVEKTEGAQQIDITPESFGGNFYIEASTLFRDKATGADWPAEFIIPNGKVQSNFTFTMAASGDPSTFTFTVDAFPDYTRFDKTKKVQAALQIIEPELQSNASSRDRTKYGVTTTTTTTTDPAKPAG